MVQKENIQPECQCVLLYFLSAISIILMKSKVGVRLIIAL